MSQAMDSLVGCIDLHVHTTASDGSCSPAEAVALAADLGLAAIAITDHDTMSGCAEAAEAGFHHKMEVIPGIEISTRFETAVHILGYYPDACHPALHTALNEIVEERDHRNTAICALMQQDGLPVDYQEMKRRFGEVIGRPHFAALLVELHLAEDVQDAFRRYLEVGQRYFLRRSFLTLQRSISVIADAGGIPVLAHPFQYRLDDTGLRRLIEQSMDYGLRGMECLYSGYSADQSRYLMALAEEYGLLVTGGSDFHGSAKPHIHLGTGTGDLHVPCLLLDQLQEAHKIQRLS